MLIIIGFILFSVIFWWPLHNAFINALIEVNPMYSSLEFLQLKIIAALIIFPLLWVLHPILIFTFIVRKDRKLTYYEYLVLTIKQSNI